MGDSGSVEGGEHISIDVSRSLERVVHTGADTTLLSRVIAFKTLHTFYTHIYKSWSTFMVRHLFQDTENLR